MKTEDIDKKIGMPDVDAEWARFEREVIGEETQAKKRSLAPWAWGIGIAASIAVVTRLFLFGNGSKGEKEGSVAMQSPATSLIINLRICWQKSQTLKRKIPFKGVLRDWILFRIHLV